MNIDSIFQARQKDRKERIKQVKNAVGKRFRAAKKTLKSGEIMTGAESVFSLESEIESYLALHNAHGHYVQLARFMNRALARIGRIRKKHLPGFISIPELKKYIDNRACRENIAGIRDRFMSFTGSSRLSVSAKVAEYERDSENRQESTSELDNWFKAAEAEAEKTVSQTAMLILDRYGSEFLSYRDPALDNSFVTVLQKQTSDLYESALRWFEKQGRRAVFPGIVLPVPDLPEFKAETVFGLIKNSLADFFPSLTDQIGSTLTDYRTSLKAEKFKRGGAFTDPVSPEAGPYLFMTFRGRLNDALVLAHETGHMFYYLLRSKKDFFSYAASDLHSETAAAFTEFLALDALLPAGPQKQTAARRLVFTKTVRQNIIFEAEYDYYLALLNNPGSAGAFAGFWQRSWDRFQNESGSSHRSWFSYNRHYINYPLYGITYVAGTLAGLGFYNQLMTGELGKEEFIEFLKSDLSSCSGNELFMNALSAGLESSAKILEP